MQLTIGIDISKHRLDAYRLSDRRHIQVANDRAGLQALLKWIGGGELPLVVFEATGAYHRRLEAALSTSGIPFARVNPRQSRRFAEATGRLAKTDRVDATMLARMGAVLELEGRDAPHESLYDFKELMAARRALIKDRAAARTRLCAATVPLVKRQLAARIKQIEMQLTQIDAAIASRVAEDEATSRKLAILVSIPGIGEATALSMLVEMPELGRLEGKQAASLAGLAPVSRQAGTWQGRERSPGRPAASPALNLHACPGGDALQRRPKGEIRATRSRRQIGQGCHHSRHAQARRHGERPAARRPRMVRNPALISTDTQRTLGRRNSPMSRATSARTSRPRTSPRSPSRPSGGSSLLGPEANGPRLFPLWLRACGCRRAVFVHHGSLLPQKMR